MIMFFSTASSHSLVGVLTTDRWSATIRLPIIYD